MKLAEPAGRIVKATRRRSMPKFTTALDITDEERRMLLRLVRKRCNHGRIGVHQR